jgi:glycosyltransferase involved in cell wall biosynthesis
MKILIYTESFRPAVGGIERITLELARGVAEWDAPDSNGEMFDITLVTRTAAGATRDGKLPFRMVRRPSFRELLELVRGTEVLHLAGPAFIPLALGLALGKPVVIEHHGFQAVCPNGQLFYAPNQRLCEGHYMAGRYAKCLQCNIPVAGLAGSAKWLFLTPFRRWLSNCAATNIAPTAWLASVLNLRRMKSVYHGISLTSTNHPVVPVRPTFVFQGRLVSTKGAEVLLEAAKQLHAEGLDFEIRIIGDGPERSQLEAQAQSLGDCIQFLGHVSEDQLGKVLADISTVVVPSLAGEVFGLVVAENMLRGKLLIVSNIGSLEEVIGTAGMVSPAGNVAALASCMRRVIQDPSLVLTLGAEARARAMQLFGVRNMVQSHVSIYQEAGR